MDHKNFCALPWVGLDVSSQGFFRPCCKYNGNMAETYTEYLNSEELKELKQDFLDGKKPDKCVRCWQDEDVGIKSKRLLDKEYILNNYSINFEKAKVLTVAFAFGSTCNLACRVCSSSTSSRWRAEAQKMKKSLPEIPIYDHKKFYTNEQFLQDIHSFVDSVIHVDIYGGEPFLSGLDQHKDFLRALLPRAKEITIHYTTNCTIFPDEEFWQLWRQFKKIDMQLSIDGIGTVFEFNRWPAVWNDCYKNIKLFQQKQKELTNIQLSISTVISIFTVRYIPELLEWCRTEQLPYPYLGFISKPEYYDITVLPNRVKLDVKEKLSQHKDLKFIVDRMMSNDNSHLLDTTEKYIKTLDQYRNQQFNIENFSIKLPR